MLVTGVGRAGQIGNAVALAFGKAGAKIVACDLNAVGVAERVREFAAQGVDARPCAGDLTEPDIAALAVEIALKHFGRLDVVVNVAGGLTTLRAHRRHHRSGAGPRDRHQPQDRGSGLPGRHRGVDPHPGLHHQLLLDRLLQSPESHGGVLGGQGRRRRVHPEPGPGAAGPARPRQRRSLPPWCARWTTWRRWETASAQYVEMQEITDGVMSLAAPTPP